MRKRYSVLVPARFELAAQQQRLGEREMRAGQQRIERDRLARAGDAGVEVEPAIMHDGEVVVGAGIAGVERDRALAGRLRRVVAAEALVHGAEVAPVERRVDAVLQRAFDQRRGLGDAAAAERDEAGEVQCIRLLRRDGERPSEQRVRVVEPVGALVFLGDAQHLAERQRDFRRDYGGHCADDRKEKVIRR